MAGVTRLIAGAPIRALLTSLDAWVRDGRKPPPSRVPLRQTGALVEAAVAVPAIPSLAYAAIHTVAARMDQTRLPVIEIGRYPIFVPHADADGTAMGGIRVPLLDAPRAMRSAIRDIVLLRRERAVCTVSVQRRKRGSKPRLRHSASIASKSV